MDAIGAVEFGLTHSALAVTDALESRLTRYALACTLIAAIVVAGSVWTGHGQQANRAVADAGINVAGLLSSADIANLPVRNVGPPL